MFTGGIRFVAEIVMDEYGGIDWPGKFLLKC